MNTGEDEDDMDDFCPGTEDASSEGDFLPLASNTSRVLFFPSSMPDLLDPAASFSFDVRRLSIMLDKREVLFTL